jgi:hypothetical protein
MPELNFVVEGAQPTQYAVAPLLSLKLRINNATPEIDVQNVMLQCQIRIEATRRHYEAGEHDRLKELFGEPARWSRTLRSLLWTHASVLVPPFDETCVVDLPVPCSFDFNVAATKYFHGLDGGDVPLVLLFSGTVFYREPGGTLQLAQIAWDREASFRLPIKVWQDMMDHYYPGSVWLRLSRDAFERVYRYKRERGLPTFEQTLTSLLDRAPRAEREGALP